MQVQFRMDYFILSDFFVIEYFYRFHKFIWAYCYITLDVLCAFFVGFRKKMLLFVILCTYILRNNYR